MPEDNDESLVDGEEGGEKPKVKNNKKSLFQKTIH